MEQQKITDLQIGYDRVAEEYVKRIFDELVHKPLDRALLNRFAEQVRGVGLAGDIGCGPGHVTRYLYERGLEVCGIDLSPRMVALARRLNPGITFQQGNILDLDCPDAVWGGITAFYSIIHIPREDVVRALQEFRRVLRPGGLLLLAFHVGQDILHVDEWWGEPVSLDFIFFQPEEMTGYLHAAGFEIDEVIERPPYPEVEHQSQRAYIFARKPPR